MLKISFPQLWIFKVKHSMELDIMQDIITMNNWMIDYSVFFFCLNAKNSSQIRLKKLIWLSKNLNDNEK